MLAALLIGLAGPGTTATELLSHVTGHVTTTNGDAVAACTVQLSTINGTIATTTTDSSGQYSFDVPLGTYTIQAYKLTIVDNYVGSVSTSVLHSTTKDIALKPLPSKFTLTQSKSSIVADGLDYTALTAHITDAWDKVVPDCTVSLENEETGFGTISNSPTKATSSTITLTHDAGANYVGYYGWASNPGTGKVSQATVKLIVTQPSTDFSSTQYFYINVKAAPTPTPSVNAPAPEAPANTAAPVTTASFQGQAGEAPGTYASDVEVTLTAIDNSGSGILRTEYGLGNMSWITYGGP
ncbi:MAG TPA: carboxypeptidase-like regulatory domain-containing protein, partial [Methanocella sp.]|nr:carboxypeptidase-like regulatory domain-containing protein [Methanocella sp.]